MSSAHWGVKNSPYLFYKILLKWFRNTRITPVATYLAYKATGYADTGPIGGMTISDFVSVWTPYNNGGSGDGDGGGGASRGIAAGMGNGAMNTAPRDGIGGEKRYVILPLSKRLRMHEDYAGNGFMKMLLEARCFEEACGGSFEGEPREFEADELQTRCPTRTL